MYRFKQPNFIHVLKRTLSTNIEQGKKLAAIKAVEETINPNKHKVIGIGSGSTIKYAIDQIAQREDLKHLIYIPTSYQTKQLITDMKLTLGTLEE